MSASAAEKGSSTRKSDYRSKAEADTEMGRNPPPEGVCRLEDLLTDLGDIAKQQAKQTVRGAAQTTPADTSGGGGDQPAPTPTPDHSAGG